MKTVSDVIKYLLRQEPYYGMFACGLNKEFTDKISTAGVCLDEINYKLLINKDFWYSLTPNERIGVLKHELLHLCFYHVLDQDLYSNLCTNHEDLNVAMDLEVQSYIDEPFRYKKCAAEKLFADFPNLPRKMGTKFYINFLNQIRKYEMNGEKTPNFTGDYDNAVRDLRDGAKDNSHSQWGEPSDTRKELARNQIDYQQKEAANSVIKSRGTLPSELEEALNKLLKPKPPVFNWKAYFRRLLGIAFDVFLKKTRRKESDRFEDAFGLKRRKKHKLLVAVDTSGSVNQEELEEFFSEIYHIWKAGADVHILECDAKIQKEYDYKGKCPANVSGRGGTKFTPCIDYYNQHRKEYTTMVYFTDGYGDQYDCKPLNKMLWVITSNGNQSDKFPGVKICIPQKQK